MGALSPAKAQALDGLVRSLPDGVLGTLRAALSSDTRSGAWAEPVRVAAEAEIDDRRLRDAVLRELSAMARPRAGAMTPLNALSPWAPARIWRGLRETSPQMIDRVASLRVDRDHAGFEAASIELLQAAAEGLDGGTGPFALVLTQLEKSVGGAERAAHIAQVSVLVRHCISRARDWLKTGAGEDAAAVRLALGDASALCLEGGPLFMDVLAAQFDEPWTALRLTSAVMEKPKETFLAGSELAVFAEQIFDAADQSLQIIRSYDIDCGREAGAAAAAAVQFAVDGSMELEMWVRLDRDQPWGRRVAALKRGVVAAVELRFKEVDGLLAAALPVQSTRPAAKGLRGHPDLTSPVSPLTINRAEAGLVFLQETRRAAVTGGFAGLRGKVVEAVDTRIDTYSEDLLELIRAPNADGAEEARARLPVVADFLGLVREPAAGQMLRRRMAALAA